MLCSYCKNRTDSTMNYQLKTEGCIIFLDNDCINQNYLQDFRKSSCDCKQNHTVLDSFVIEPNTTTSLIIPKTLPKSESKTTITSNSTKLPTKIKTA